ncbi:GIY-YIG nuclease family protein, partial [Actinotignum sp. GS-2025b]|uniref:GIY-YIG nuclease family protein n=1 Tax=Actinotignum sp. GS-2025b TaxID=3427275 RepID=UPI003F45DFC3
SCFTVVILVYLLGGFHPHTQTIRHSPEQSPTYLMAPVEIVDTYVTYDVNAAKLEHLLHQIFADVKVSLSQIDNEGKNYDPSEWFIVPREAIATAVELIQNGENTRYRYDKGSESFVPVQQ